MEFCLQNRLYSYVPWSGKSNKEILGSGDSNWEEI